MTATVWLVTLVTLTGVVVLLLVMMVKELLVTLGAAEHNPHITGHAARTKALTVGVAR